MSTPEAAAESGGSPRDDDPSEKLLVLERRIHWGWLLSSATVLLTLLGAMYLWGYWRTFGINYLDYIGFAQILEKSVLSFLPVVMLVASFSAIAFLVMSTKRMKAWEEAARLKREERRKKNRIPPEAELFLFTFGIAVVSAVLSAVMLEDDAGALISMPFFFAAFGVVIGQLIAPKYDAQIGFSAGLLTGLIPLMCFLAGVQHAEFTREQKGDQVNTVTFSSKVEGLSEDHIFVGRMGGHVFMASRRFKETIIVPESLVQSIEVRTPKKKPNAE